MSPPTWDTSGVGGVDYVVHNSANRGPHKSMSILATTSNDLKFHQWPDGSLHQSYLPSNYNEGPIKTISWGKDGNWVVVVPQSGPAEVISIKENVKLLQTIQDIYNPTCAVFQNGTKKNIAIGTATGQVLVYDIKARSIRKRFPRAISTIFNLQYNAKDTHIAAACNSGEILLFSNMTSNISCSYKVPKSDSVSAINFHRSKRNLLAAGSEEGVIATWDINTGMVQCEALAHHGPVTDVIYSPLRSDLLVTSGLDHRFSFYDLLANKCVLEVEVSSSITSLDYSYCGTYLGLGSQNGNVVLYDTRSLSKPISAFTAHDGKKIRHLSFQKVPTLNDEVENSSYDFSSEDVSVKHPQEQECKNQTADSLGLVVCDDTNIPTKEENTRKLSQDAEDSFLAAMGFDNSNQTEASIKQANITGLGITEEVKKWMDSSKRTSIHQNANLNCLPEQISAMQTPAPSLNQVSSTPKYLIREPSVSSLSPIVGANGDAPGKLVSSSQLSISPDDMKQLIRDVVKEEMQTHMDEIKLELAEFYTNMRRHFLDIQMSLAKEFVDIESLLDKSNNVTVREFICDDFLINQNNQLLKELESLKKQLGDKSSIFRKH